MAVQGVWEGVVVVWRSRRRVKDVRVWTLSASFGF